MNNSSMRKISSKLLEIIETINFDIALLKIDQQLQDSRSLRKVSIPKDTD